MGVGVSGFGSAGVAIGRLVGVEIEEIEPQSSSEQVSTGIPCSISLHSNFSHLCP